MTDQPSPAATPIIPVARYSSAGQRPQDRYAEWREGSLIGFGRLYDTVPVEPFGVETSLAQLGAVGFAHSLMTAQRWHRTQLHYRGDASDPLMVAIRLAGRGDGDADGRSVVAPPGCVVLSDFSRPFSHDSEAASTVVLRIPREVAERTLPAVRNLHGLVIPPDQAMLLRAHARAMIDALAIGVPAAQAERLGRITLDLLELGIGQVRPWAVTTGATATGARMVAEAAIERNLGSDALTIGNLCRWASVSRATLYRLFEADGGVQAYVTGRRLARVAQDLEGGTATIADLAERWGFPSESHLSRRFRARYAMSPADYRARGRA